MKMIRKYIFLQLVILVYIIGLIPSKLASNEPFLSFKFCLYYGLLFLSLAIYAILWQQILKKLPLTIAYVNKSTTIIWSMIIGFFLFKEKVTIFNIIGAIVVIIGIIVMIKGEHNNE